MCKIGQRENALSNLRQYAISIDGVAMEFAENINVQDIYSTNSGSDGRDVTLLLSRALWMNYYYYKSSELSF